MARIDVSDYLLGELSGEELAEAERLLREDPEFRAQVERLSPLVGRLEELPPEAWTVDDQPPLLPAPDRSPEPPRRSRWRLALPPAFAAGAAAVLMAIGVGIGVLVSGNGDGAGDGTTVALEPVDTVAASGSATFVGAEDPDEVAVELSGLDPSAEGEHYELWLLSSSDDLVSLGSFRVPASGSAEFQVPLPVEPSAFEFVDISIEPNDGDASHSGRSVLRAST